METLSWMSDYFPVRLLALAQAAERRFEETLLSCPRRGEVIQVLDREVFTPLLENRMTSLLFSLAALDAYLSYYAHQTDKLIAAGTETSLQEYLARDHLLSFFQNLPNRLRRRHELILEENGRQTVAWFLSRAPLELEMKLLYFPVLRAQKMVNWEDGYMKKLSRILGLAAELTSPALALAPELRPVTCREELEEVFLRHDLPPGVTPGRSAGGEYVVEPYTEGHFLWELLHCYPTRTVQEVIQYIHRLDNSENHFLTVMRAVALTDGEGRPLTEPAKKYVMEIMLEQE